ncbi:hypothetical protein BDEG_24421 [Batrachochytrium dendrobatidis JEL423]|uniref:RRM domain-containing protein n=1 Tax=Batrachochytrium dendrobatidis (strain JEL423) TaxID=403673 RepID=A0A177WLP4_BATDL|nr:hypothetical protein BDEG_24421 [Batrachochytrium dendrobatidis JEL423]
MHDTHWVDSLLIWWSLGDDGSYTYDPTTRQWFPFFDEELIKAQQSAYYTNVIPSCVMDPADEPESQPEFNHHLDEHANEKRKSGTQPTQNLKRKKPKHSTLDAQPKKRVNTAVYVTHLPHDTTVTELHDLFSKCGIILEDPSTNIPKIKLYVDDQGCFKGDALVIFFKEESVELAVQLMDDTLFRAGDGIKIRVQKAVFQEKPAGEAHSDEKGKSGSGKPNTNEKKPTQTIRQKMERQVLTHSSPHQSIETNSNPKNNAKANKVVVLKKMFTLKELQDDPTLLLDLKQDVREECEKLGQVTNVVLYDLEEDGIMTVRFKDVESAAACVLKMNGRFFGGQTIEASLLAGKEKFKQSKGQTEEEEKKRIEAYEIWLESQH